MNANSVASGLVWQEILSPMKESILERSLMNANSVESVSVYQEV